MFLEKVVVGEQTQLHTMFKVNLGLMELLKIMGEEDLALKTILVLLAHLVLVVQLD